MSIAAMVTILDHAPASWCSGQRMVAIVIADHVDLDGYCWPGVARIAARSGLSVRQVRKHLTQLEAEGIITRIHRTGTSNLYRWELWTTLAPRREGLSSTTGGVLHSTTGGGVSYTTGGDCRP